MLNKIFYLLLLFYLAGCNSGNRSSTMTANESAPTTALRDSLTRELRNSYTRIDSSLGQTVYVPVYSHIYQQNHKMTFNLTATLSIRNADITNAFSLKSVLYYDSKGKLVKNYLEEPITVKPQASTSFVVEENDLRGGVGANFIVAWKAEQPVFPPVVEAVMISTSQQQGISFVSKGRVLENQNPHSPASN